MTEAEQVAYALRLSMQDNQEYVNLPNDIAVKKDKDSRSDKNKAYLI